MFKDSNELLEYTLRELQVAVKENKSQVEILLKERFPTDINRLRKYCDNLELKTITATIRKEFKDYNIRSVVEPKGYREEVMTFNESPYVMYYPRYYPLVWTLTLRKK